MGMILKIQHPNVSFEAGMSQFGASRNLPFITRYQLGRGEPIEDSARVISSMLTSSWIRTFGHDIVKRFAFILV